MIKLIIQIIRRFYRYLGSVSRTSSESSDDHSSTKSSKRDKNSKKDKNPDKSAKASPKSISFSTILLEDGLNKFFENSHTGILIIGDYMTSMWRDNGVYLAYDPKPRNSKGIYGKFFLFI